MLQQVQRPCVCVCLGAWSRDSLADSKGRTALKDIEQICDGVDSQVSKTTVEALGSGLGGVRSLEDLVGGLLK